MNRETGPSRPASPSNTAPDRPATGNGTVLDLLAGAYSVELPHPETPRTELPRTLLPNRGPLLDPISRSVTTGIPESTPEWHVQMARDLERLRVAANNVS